MCVSPTSLNDGTLVACRLCWQCRLARIDDWCGRCIAESKSVFATSAITLTYGRDDDLESDTYGEADHPAAAYLTYSDVQKYLKLLRRHGYPLRYFVTGEYGSEKGRAHWHIVIFWLKDIPPHFLARTKKDRFLHYRLEKRDPHPGEKKEPWFPDGMWPVYYENGTPAMWWPHGTSYWTAPNYANFRYNMKYILKDMQGDRVGHIGLSKKPPIGASYFIERAHNHVRDGLSPQGTNLYVKDSLDPDDVDSPGGYVYTFPEARRKTGKLIQFTLKGATLRLFLDAFIEKWFEVHGNYSWPRSRLVDEYYNPHVDRNEREDQADFERRMEVLEENGIMRRELSEKLMRWNEPFEQSNLYYDTKLLGFVYEVKPSKRRVYEIRLIWKEGKWQWLGKNGEVM